MSKYASLINFINEDNTLPADLEIGTAKQYEQPKVSENTGFKANNQDEQTPAFNSESKTKFFDKWGFTVFIGIVVGFCLFLVYYFVFRRKQHSPDFKPASDLQPPDTE